MKITKSFTSILIILLTAFLVTACGGGGGGGDDSSDSVDSTTGVGITSTNAKDITTEVLTSVDVAEGAATDSTFLPGITTTISDSDFSYSDLIIRQLQEIPTVLEQTTTSVVAGITLDEEYTCSNGGTYTLYADISSTIEASVGDELTYTFYNCEIQGVIFNGGMVITITALSGDLDAVPYTLGVDTFLDEFSLSYGDLVTTADGDMSMLMSEDVGGNGTLVISGDSFKSTEASETVLLLNYLYEFAFNNLTYDFSVELAGTVDSTVIGGSVSYVTLEPFTGNDNLANANPTAGVLHIATNIDNSQALVTAQPDGINIQIEVDADGDGTYETLIMTTWTEVEGL